VLDTRVTSTSDVELTSLVSRDVHPYLLTVCLSVCLSACLSTRLQNLTPRSTTNVTERLLFIYGASETLYDHNITGIYHY